MNFVHIFCCCYPEKRISRQLIRGTDIQYAKLGGVQSNICNAGSKIVDVFRTILYPDPDITMRVCAFRQKGNCVTNKLQAITQYHRRPCLGNFRLAS